jgi:hypothetical protein
MQRDIHFYGVYALARAAGIDWDTSRTIACASQFVDDATDEGVVILPDLTANQSQEPMSFQGRHEETGSTDRRGNNRQALRVGQKGILPIMTSHRPLDYSNTIPGDQWRVWVPFHFLPGNEPLSGSFLERMICRKDSQPARRMLRHALDWGWQASNDPASTRDCWPHLIGITAHVYADTFSHHGFIGMAHPWNKVKGRSLETAGNQSASFIDCLMNKVEACMAWIAGELAEMVPIGHGAVAACPDLPYLRWRFEYEERESIPGEIQRDNPVDFLAGCEGLFRFLRGFSKRNSHIRDPKGPRDWHDISRHVQRLLGIEASTEDRCQAWKEAIVSGCFCRTTEIDKTIRYDPDSWSLRKTRATFTPTGDAYRFLMAAWRHQTYVLRELLPEIGLLA